MKLFNVTYEKICSPSEGLYMKEYKGYYMCSSLDRLYNYLENELHVTVKNIEILHYFQVDPPKKIEKKNKNKNTTKGIAYGLGKHEI